jgi:nitrogen fixation protein
MVGCARVEITKITPENPYTKGIRFYRPYPYLWVTKDKEGNLEGKIVYLPKTNEEYAIKVKSGIGTVDTKFTLEDGWRLTQFGETRDSKSVEMVNALTGSLKDLKGFFEKVIKEELYPGLYMFEFDHNTGLISGLKPVLQFK